MRRCGASKKFELLRLNATTLIEVLVSFSLASILFVIGAMVWLQLAGKSAPYRLAEQRMDCRSILRETERTMALTDRIISLHNTQYHRQVRPLDASRGIFEVGISVYSAEGDLLFRRKKIMHHHAD